MNHNEINKFQCEYCGIFCKDGKCPFDHDGTKCKFCQRYNRNGICPISKKTNKYNGCSRYPIGSLIEDVY